MDTDAIAEALATAFACDPASRPIKIPARLATVASDTQTTQLEVGLMIEPVLRAQPEFQERGYLFSDGTGGGMGFYSQPAAQFLVGRVLEGRSYEEAIADLRYVLEIRTAECLAVLTLWGVEVSEPIQLPEHLTLVPFEALPESQAKWALQQ